MEYLASLLNLRYDDYNVSQTAYETRSKNALKFPQGGVVMGGDKS